jgi:hypothetical protein
MVNYNSGIMRLPMATPMQVASALVRASGGKLKNRREIAKQLRKGRVFEGSCYFLTGFGIQGRIAISTYGAEARCYVPGTWVGQRVKHGPYRPLQQADVAMQRNGEPVRILLAEPLGDEYIELPSTLPNPPRNAVRNCTAMGGMVDGIYVV